MNIKETFLKLTSKTYPYGYEDELIPFLPKGYFQDEHGNFYYKIGDSRTAFTCHLDTACKAQVDVEHVIEGNIIKTNGKSILGADDKAGVTILLYLIENNVPGLYCFFYGEECGCIGSGLASKDSWTKDYDRMIAFDRKATHSIITFQSSRRCCSDEFAKTLAKEYNHFGMNMSPDDTGVYTDSAEFVDFIPECTNISVGYYSEHTHAERQDIAHLIKLAKASVKIDWENLPIKRNKNAVEHKSYYEYNQHCTGYGHRRDRWCDGEVSTRSNRRKDFNYDEWYDQTYNFKGNVSKGKTYNNPSGYFKDANVNAYINQAKNNFCECLVEHKGPCIPVSKKKGRVFYNSLDNELDNDFIIDEPRSKNYYEVLTQIIFDDKISARDWETLKDQYLDMSNPQDEEFARYMQEQLN